MHFSFREVLHGTAHGIDELLGERAVVFADLLDERAQFLDEIDRDFIGNQHVRVLLQRWFVGPRAPSPSEGCGLSLALSARRARPVTSEGRAHWVALPSSSAAAA